MELTEVLERSGGLCTREQLVSGASRAAFDEAVRTGAVQRLDRGRYVAAGVAGAASTAFALTGSLCLESAALAHGWEVKHPPALPHVLVPRNRNVLARQRAVCVVHRGRTEADLVTPPDQTLRMCLRSLPFDRALTVADSALRHGYDAGRLRRLAARMRGPGSVQARRVAGSASPLAYGPMESVARAIADDVTGLHVRPQVAIRVSNGVVRVDLADPTLRVIIETDSFAWHGDRTALHRDARRYNELVSAGWLVVRLSWEEVMFHPDRVAAMLRRLVRVAHERTVPPTDPGAAA